MKEDFEKLSKKLGDRCEQEKNGFNKNAKDICDFKLTNLEKKM